MRDLITRLRVTAELKSLNVGADAGEAADRIEKLERALRPFCFFSDDPDTTQEAWEIRYRDRFKDWIDFQDIEDARAAMSEATQ